MMTMPRNSLLLAAALVLVAGNAESVNAATAAAPGIERAGGNRAFSESVSIPPGAQLVFLAGAYPPVADASAPKGSKQQYGGDTAAQTVGALTALQGTLKSLGLTLGDVVQAHVFLVGDPDKDGEIDFAGFQSGWSQFFGTPEQPNKPARSAVKVAGLVSRGVLVEIELIAARLPSAAR
jgi:enamine deaminase RidA (YjgF/YER057c/UK114 family)